MKLFIFLMHIAFNTANAEYPSVERYQDWQSMSDRLNQRTLYTLMDSLYSLPREPWPEPFKTILLRMCTYYKAHVNAVAAGQPVIIDETAGRSEQDGDLYEMVSWQSDLRFIPFQADFSGGPLAARGLARIGEPAFETVINAFDIDGFATIHFDAAKALELMMQKEHSFLRSDERKQAIARHALIRSAQSKDNLARMGAVSALRYFANDRVYILLELVSQNDPYAANGQYPIRSRAQEALQFIRRQR